MPRGEARHVVVRVLAEPVLRAEYVVAEGMRAEHHVLEAVVNQLGRRVVVALYFVAHHLDFLLHLGLRIRAVQHYVGKQIDGARHMLAQQRRVEHRVLLVGEGVEVAAHPFEAVQDLHGAAARRALERHVLAEVGQALLARQLVARACAHGVAAIHHGRRRSQMDDAQPVAQSMCVVFHNPGCKIT